MASVQFNGVRIHWAEKGEGKAVLFLHAFPLNSAVWSKQTSALKEAGYRAIVLDLPGFGKSEKLSGPASMDLFAQVTLAVLDAAKVEKAAVVAMSMGGYAAFELRERAPSRVAALCLCATRATPDTAESKKAREATARAVLEDGMQVLSDRLLPNLLSGAASPALKRDVEKIITENSPEGAAAALRAMAGRRDFTGALKDIGCPTLVLVGDKDTLSPPADAQLMAQAVPGAKYETIPGTGHLSNLENPKAFDQALRTFLDAHRERM